jgi:hypothetical protein
MSEEKAKEVIIEEDDGERIERDKDVFDDLGIKLKSTKQLRELEAQRSICPKCKKSKKFFCYDCIIPFGNNIPIVDLPIALDMYVLKNKFTKVVVVVIIRIKQQLEFIIQQRVEAKAQRYMQHY